MSEQQGAIELKGLVKRFGEVVAVDHLDLSIRPGEIFSILGGSGSGKTTLLRLLAGFEQPDAGTVRIDGQDLAGIPAYRRPVNMMFQSYALFPHLSVASNIAYGLHQRRPKPSRAEIDAAVEEALAMVKLVGFGKRMPHQLSGGQRQRVALARAIVKRPKVLLLDEPLGALDKKLREQTQLELIRIQVATNITFIIVTHDQEEAMALSDRIAVMDRGRIVQMGTARELYEQPASAFVADFIGSVNLFNAEVKGVEGDHLVAGCSGLGEGVKLPLGAAGGDREIGAGTKLKVAIRPERLEIVPVETPKPEGADWNFINGKSRDVAFMGDHLKLAMELPDGTVVRAISSQSDRTAASVACSSAVRLQWRTDAAQWFPVAEDGSA
jgi:putrescine transport system ATP-binding protein